MRVVRVCLVQYKLKHARVQYTVMYFTDSVISFDYDVICVC